MQRTVKISSKGQITLPKAARDALGSRFVRLTVEKNGSVRVDALPELGGSLRKYARNADAKLSWDEIRDRAWSAEIRARRNPKRR
jgi:hypothetical protein